MTTTIGMGRDIPLRDYRDDMTGALRDWLQPLVYAPIKKTVMGFQVVETQNQVQFTGVVQPFTDRQLLLKPIGQRAWTWAMLHANTNLLLDVDDVVFFQGAATRVMAREVFGTYGFVILHLVQDWTNAPTPIIVSAPATTDYFPAGWTTSFPDTFFPGGW
jgi:hypothetical protein